MTNARFSRLLYGVATYIPRVYGAMSISHLSLEEIALDGYSKWLQHIGAVMKQATGGMPRIVAEIGPGPSYAAGIAALIGGCSQYNALDVIEHADRSILPDVFDRIAKHFADKRESRAWGPILPLQRFPSHLLSDRDLGELLAPSRLAALRKALADSRHGPLRVFVPWDDPAVIEKQSVDLVFSTAAMEHVDDLGKTYAAMKTWVRPGGAASHVIDYGCHGSCRDWNGHWTCSRLTWRLLKGNRPYFLNRQPHSAHTGLLRKNGFKILAESCVRTPSPVRLKMIDPEIATCFSENDLDIQYAFIQARNDESPVYQP